MQEPKKRAGWETSHTAPYETVVPARPPNPLCLILKWSMKSPNGLIATSGGTGGSVPMC